MAQCRSFVQGSISANNWSFYEYPRKPLLPIKHKQSFSWHGKSAKFLRHAGLPFYWLGPTWVKSNVVEYSYKAKSFDRVEVFPPIQTLRRFPEEGLSSKVVMYIYEAGARVILTSSWNLKRNAKILSVEAVAELLSSILQLNVVPVKCISAHQLQRMELKKEDIILLENLSNYKEELANHSEFARRLASGVDIFVNDSFSSAHKILASTVGVTQFCCACLAGFYVEECLDKLKKISGCSQSPCVAVIGGGNLVDKAAALRFLASKCDGLIFVGVVALQIMHVLGMPVPLNLVEQGGAEEALELVRYAEDRSIPILLPKDFWCNHNHLQMRLFPADDILDGWAPIDLGPNSFDEIASFLSRCKKIIWIGPLKFGQSDHDTSGASKLARILDELSENDCAITIIGHKPCESMLRISRSASAYEMIDNASVVWEFLKGRSLPGLLALDRAYPFEIDWSMIYPDPTQPLAVDIGSGNGLFLVGMAVMRKDLNFLGLEINNKLVTRCLESAGQSGLDNLHFIATNATSSFRTIVSSYPGQLVLVSIQCPNPDFNQPEHRWRMVQRSLVEAIADLLTPGGKLFLQSDVEEVAKRMRKQFLEGNNQLDIVYDDSDTIFGPGGWLKENPFGVWSDWERHVIARGAPMYRLMFNKR